MTYVRKKGPMGFNRYFNDFDTLKPRNGCNK